MERKRIVVEQEMHGQVALITGGARGLGQAMAQRLAAAGAAVWVTNRTASAPQQVDAPAPGQIAVARLDVTNEGSVIALVERVMAANGRLDVLVNNAGVGVFKPVVETSLAEWQEILATNLTGAFLCAREAFRHMQVQGGGRIINIGSVSGYIPIVENGAYGASKYGLAGLTAILNEEGKAHRIRVSIVHPGAVWTEIWDGREGFDPADMLTPADIAETVYDIARRPLHVRIDEVRILPPKGVL